MANRNAPLEVGQRAPEFALKTANSADGRDIGTEVTLRELLAHGPVIVEFLRGTW